MAARVLRHLPPSKDVKMIGALSAPEDSSTTWVCATAESVTERRYENARGGGKMCTVTLVDKQGGGIRAVAFGGDADYVRAMMVAGEEYFIYNFVVKKASDRWPMGLQFKRSTQIWRTSGDPDFFTGDLATVGRGAIISLRGTVTDITGEAMTLDTGAMIKNVRDTRHCVGDFVEVIDVTGMGEPREFIYSDRQTVIVRGIPPN